MKFYWGSGSPYAWRAMLALIVKEIDFEDELLSFSEREHKTPEYMALSPRGKVPTLVDGDVVVNESLAIMMYIDRKVPEPSLFGTTPAEVGRIAQRVFDHENHLLARTLDVLGPIFRRRAEGQVEELREQVTALAEELGKFDRMLENDTWLGGERVSAADVVLYPTLCLIDRVAAHADVAKLELGLRAVEGQLAGFKRRFAALPNVDRAYPPHWKQ